MAFEEGVVGMSCPGCDTAHRIRWSRIPVRERATVKCLVCDAMVFEGKDCREFYDVQLMPAG